MQAVAVPDAEEVEEEPNIEELPTIADIQDERPQEVKVLEEFKKSGRWKTFLGIFAIFSNKKLPILKGLPHEIFTVFLDLDGWMDCLID